jgi:predicted RNA-binding protein YlqC (UPF0109 family)
MKSFVEYIVKNVVENPEAVQVECIPQGNDNWLLEMVVDKDDVGKVIGRGGQTIKALRTVCSVISTRMGKKVRVQLLND